MDGDHPFAFRLVLVFGVRSGQWSAGLIIVWATAPKDSTPELTTYALEISLNPEETKKPYFQCPGTSGQLSEITQINSSCCPA